MCARIRTYDLNRRSSDHITRLLQLLYHTAINHYISYGIDSKNNSFSISNDEERQVYRNLIKTGSGFRRFHITVSRLKSKRSSVSVIKTVARPEWENGSFFLISKYLFCFGVLYFGHFQLLHRTIGIGAKHILIFTHIPNLPHVW